MNIYYTESTSTGGLNTFFGALKGGARHYFIIEEGGANKNLMTRMQVIILVKQLLIDQYHKSCVLQ